MISKRQRTSTTCVVAFIGIGEEVVENVGEGSTSTAAGMEGEHSVASANLGGDNFIPTALRGMGGGFTTEASIVVPMLGVLGDESSSSKGGDNGAGDASLSRGAFSLFYVSFFPDALFVLQGLPTIQ